VTTTQLLYLSRNGWNMAGIWKTETNFWRNKTLTKC